jgi:hypothetical protein
VAVAMANDSTPAPRRFPAPWRVEKLPGGYVVRDANGQALAHVYGRATMAEAMRAVARLPSLLRGSHRHPNRVHLRLQELVTSLLLAPLRSTHLLKHICHVTPGLQPLSRKVSADAGLHANTSTELARAVPLILTATASTRL